MNAQKEFKEIETLYNELVREKSGLEAKRGELGRQLYNKLCQRPSFFSQELLTTLSANTDPKIRAGVARNANTPDTLLRKLVEDKNESVRVSMASDPYINYRIVEEKLMNDNSKAVCVALLNNPKIREDTIRTMNSLLQDSNKWPDVSELSQKKLNAREG